MFLSPRNACSESEDIQELIIKSTSPNSKCEASSTSADGMERGRDGTGAGGSTSLYPFPPPLLIPPSGQRARYIREEEEPAGCSRGNGDGGFCAKYFSVESFLLLVLVTASLLILPLVLPPLPPPPTILLLVPVAMLVLLLALAFMPTSGGRSATGPTYL